MRRYTSEHISKLISEQFDKDKMLTSVRAHQLVEEYWNNLPDPRLRAINISIHINDSRAMVISCPSSVILHYVRRQRTMIEEFYAALFQQLEISGLEITLSECQ